MNHKISSTHLSRQAYVYLRQSTTYQVESNRESTERQYALADRALTLGWDKTQIKIHRQGFRQKWPNHLGARRLSSTHGGS